MVSNTRLDLFNTLKKWEISLIRGNESGEVVINWAATESVHALKLYLINGVARWWEVFAKMDDLTSRRDVRTSIF